MSHSDLIAKRRDDGIFQTFEGHTTDSLLVLRDYIIKNENVLKEFAKNFELEYELLCNLVFLTVYLHDIGKLTNEFQQNIKSSKTSASASHAFFGLPFINSDLPEELNNLLRLAILSHHSQLYNQIFDNANLKLKVNYLKEHIQGHITSYEMVYKTFFSDIFTLEKRPLYQERIYLSHFNLELQIKRKELKSLKNGYNRDMRTKAIYCLVLSILKHCDQKASANFNDAELREKEKIYGSIIEEKALDKINYSLDLFKFSENELLNRYDLYEYQKDATNLDHYGIISAPCGRGKTEAALLAALKIIDNYKKNRIIFALPTQITSNAMYDRMKDIFSEENVGIYHGMSRFIHNEKSDLDRGEIRALVYEEKVFLKPVIVTTIDHLIYSLVHGYKQADFALGNLLNSVVIFDEIHYYENHTLRYVLDCFKILRKLQIPHIAMSGTLPEFILRRLDDEGYRIIEDKEGMEFNPFIFQREQSSIFGHLDKIEGLYLNGKNQIIILNTVKRAQEMYRALRDKIPKENLYLLHSQFTFQDRWKKESEISDLDGKRPWIIVSTQVIEISVDISCDVMHTEIAPIDAIGQRGGRLNRKGRDHKNEHILYLYEPDDHKPYYIEKKDIEMDDFVEKTSS
ncbi:MAG: CRISPR-associated helicase Cas3', partial [Spirochaetota bacterium]|nr:CRISPR-associated helicase Cas3' [Spirochaetota bacterium]